MSKASTAARALGPSSFPFSTALAIAVVVCLHLAAAPAWGLIVCDDPDLHEVTPPSDFDGVAYLSSAFGASGVLINPWYVLTARHAAYMWQEHTATFYLDGGAETYEFAEAALCPYADLAVIRLMDDTGMDGYELYDPVIYGSETGKIATLAGYGMSGTPATVGQGGDPNYPRGTLRVGYNKIDALIPDYTAGGTHYGDCLRIDLDTPNSSGPHGTVGAEYESIITVGDSGGPMFLLEDDELFVAGIHSAFYSISDPNHYPRYGDQTVDVRVASYLDWITSQMAATPAPQTGDFNNDSAVDAVDIDDLVAHFGRQDMWYDVTGDDTINAADVEGLIHTLLGTEFGDANVDLQVDIDDYNLLAANFGGSGGWGEGDFNGDGLVNFADYQILEAAFGYGTGGGAGAPPPPPLPEPTTLGLLAAGAWLGLGRRPTRRA